jgi:hypothetical protein
MFASIAYGYLCRSVVVHVSVHVGNTTVQAHNTHWLLTQCWWWCVAAYRYESLRTNLPRALMTYIDFPFTPAAMAGRSTDQRMYPLHTEVISQL